MTHLLNFLKDKQIEYSEDISLKEYTTFKIGGLAKLAIFPKTFDEVRDIILFMSNNDIKHITLGNCSNLLINSNGISIPVIFTNKLKNIELDNNDIICSSGVLLSQAANFAAENLLTGIEFAHGIPGSVGGAVYMNAGAYCGTMADVVTETIYVDSKGNIKTVKGDEHKFAKRKSCFTEDDTILQTRFSLEKGTADEIKDLMSIFARKRRSTQPLEYPSAGSIFKRPEGHYAGALIENSGLKGYTVGGAQVSEKHAGFIINKGNATSDDVKNLISHIQETVLKNYGVHLEREVKYID